MKNLTKKFFFNKEGEFSSHLRTLDKKNWTFCRKLFGRAVKLILHLQRHILTKNGVSKKKFFFSFLEIRLNILGILAEMKRQGCENSSLYVQKKLASSPENSIVFFGHRRSPNCILRVQGKVFGSFSWSSMTYFVKFGFRRKFLQRLVKLFSMCAGDSFERKKIFFKKSVFLHNFPLGAKFWKVCQNCF